MRLGITIAIAALLAGCSSNEATSPNKDGPTEAAATEPTSSDGKPADTPKGAEGTQQVKVSLPQLAYSYALGFVLPSDKIVEIQEAHRALCEKMGPSRCQLLALERGTGAEKSGNALLKLRVATGEARSFQQSISQQVTQAGGRGEQATVSTEDVSKDITDTAARIRQRELLVARLTEVLRNRAGSVAELVDAERNVTQAQEELDQARAWLGALQGRVAMSDFEIRYTAIAPSASAGSTVGLLGEAASGSLATFLIGARTLLSLAIYLAPWALLLGGSAWLVRRIRRSLATREQA